MTALLLRMLKSVWGAVNFYTFISRILSNIIQTEFENGTMIVVSPEISAGCRILLVFSVHKVYRSTDVLIKPQTALLYFGTSRALIFTS